MSYEGPKTVTFGATPQDEAQHRSARLGAKVIGATLGIAAIALGMVACAWLLNFAISLASSWGEAAKLALIALALTLTLSGLPVASAMLARSYPVEGRRAWQFWLGGLTVATVSMIVFVWQLEPQERQLATPEDPVWTSSCYKADGATFCDSELETPPQPIQPADWSPRTLFAIAAATDDGPGRRVLVLALGLLAIAGAGLLGRLAVLAMSESYRLGYGEASALPAGGVAQQHAEVSAGAAMTPADVFSYWANSRLLPAPGKSVQSTAGYEDYVATCRMNFVEPMTLTKWGLAMTTLANASRGTVVKEKTGGVMVYRGWQLASEIQGIGGSQPVAQITRRR